MLEKNRHKIFLVKVLKAISSDVILRNSLGFKGGTAAFLFYDLPRFSVDLDFDLLGATRSDEVFAALKSIVVKIGDITDEHAKRFTYFLLLRYEKGQRNIKIDVSRRQTSAGYVLGNYLGIPFLVMKKESMVARKLAAFLTRKMFAPRDAYDLWFFLKEEWDIDEQVVREQCAVSVEDTLQQAIHKAEQINPKQLLQGLGELLDEQQKAWVREKLKDELIFQLRLRISSP